MADEKPREDEEAPQKAKPKKKGFWARLKLRNWAAMIIGTSVVAHMVMLALYPILFSRGEVVSNEIDLGEYSFVDHGKKGDLARAEFSLYVNLLSEIDKVAKDRILQKKFRIRQDVEELLRQAHASDFEDPTLTELKRQMQEKINDALEMRAIESVIVTKLTLFQDEQSLAAAKAPESRRTKPATPAPAKPAAAADGPTDTVGQSTEPPDTLPELPEAKKS